MYQTVGYVLVALIALGLLQNVRRFFDEDTMARPMNERAGLLVLLAIQALGVYVLYSHCRNCQCWTGLLKGFLLSAGGMLVSHVVYGNGRVSLQSLVSDDFHLD
jgi:hypothetical protein